MSPIRKIVIHCAATPNGKAIHNAHQSAAQVIDSWHKQRGFKRLEANRQAFNPQLAHIGYHFIIDLNGDIETGRAIGETGAHVQGHNRNSIGICLVGGVGEGKEKAHGRFTAEQWNALYWLLRELESQHPQARIFGHRDLSPDLDGDGKVEPHEWLKTCPNFDVWQWLDTEEVINHEHLYKG